MNFDISILVEKIIFGSGRIKELNNYITGNTTMIVSDPVLNKLGFVTEIEKNLSGKVIKFCEVEPNPSCETVDKAAKIARENEVDSVIGFGGGSAIDAAKAVACLVSNNGILLEYLDNEKKFKDRTVILIAVPTTSGTGSEVTNVGVYTDKVNNKKKPLVSDKYWVDYAIVDPELTLSLPKRATATTALDAFIHAIEAYWAKSTQPFSETLSLKAMKLILQNIEKAYYEPDNLEARENLSTASLLAGMSFSQTRTTILHAMSFPLTNIYGLEHGFACALALPELLRENYEYDKERFDDLIKYLNFSNVEEMASKLEEIYNNINAPMKLSEIGVKNEDINKIAEITLSAPISRLNPKEFDSAELIKLFKKIY